MCLTEQIELGGCVFKGWAPGGQNNDSQLALAHSVWEHKAGDVSLEKKKTKKKLPSKQGLTAVSAARPERLSSAVHIVFEQLALICHLVWTGFVEREGEALCSYQ